MRVRVVVLAGAEALAFSVSTLLPEVGLVLHDAVTPVGNADARARVTFPVNPSASVIEMVVEAEPF